MIPAIATEIFYVGVMIGAYIIAKMLYIIGLDGDDNKASDIAKICCILAILASVAGIVLLYFMQAAVVNAGSRLGN